MAQRPLHDWQVTVAQAEDIQRSLAVQVVRQGAVESPRYIAGVDISGELGEGVARGAVVVLGFPQLAVEEVSVVEQGLYFPYVPGLLSFREVPLILAAWERLTLCPDLVVADAQGIAHPRRLGMASHLGLLLGVPAIGCAKSILCGRHGELGEERGARAELVHRGEVVGAALRTRQGVRPVYVSIGHLIDLEGAVRWVLACCRGYRLPEPTRLAHLAAGGRQLMGAQVKGQREKTL